MGTFLVYILKSAVCLAMFYLFYRLLLSKETFHRFNRMALLGVMLLSCLLPLVKVTVEQASSVNAQVMSTLHNGSSLQTVCFYSSVSGPAFSLREASISSI